jgi:hypothetical protein
LVRTESSDAHRHQDVAVLVLGVGIFGAHLAGGLRVLELEANFAFVAERLKKVEDVDGIEADDDGVARVGRVDGVFALSGLGGVGADFEFVAFEAKADGAGALVGKLGDALNGRGELAGADDGKLGVVARHDRLKVGELAGELAGAERAVADTEEECVLVVGKLDGLGLGGVEQLLQFLERFARNQHTLFAADAFEVLVGLFDVGEAMAIGGDHGERLSLDDQQCAVEGVARLLVGDGEDGAGDEGLERKQRNVCDRDGGKLGHLGIIGARHADDFGIGAAAANLDPVVFKQFDGDFSVRQELDVVVKFAGRDGAGAGLFDFDLGAGADSLIKVGGGNVQPVLFGFEQKIRQNWNGSFALDHALRRCKFLQQILAAYGNLHRCPLYGWLLYFGFARWHVFTPDPDAMSQAIFLYGHTLQHRAAPRKWLSFLLLDCIHLKVCVRVENEGDLWITGLGDESGLVRAAGD